MEQASNEKTIFKNSNQYKFISKRLKIHENVEFSNFFNYPTITRQADFESLREGRTISITTNGFVKLSEIRILCLGPDGDEYALCEQLIHMRPQLLGKLEFFINEQKIFGSEEEIPQVWNSFFTRIPRSEQEIRDSGLDYQKSFSDDYQGVDNPIQRSLMDCMTGWKYNNFNNSTQECYIFPLTCWSSLFDGKEWLPPGTELKFVFPYNSDQLANTILIKPALGVATYTSMPGLTPSKPFNLNTYNEALFWKEYAPRENSNAVLQTSLALNNVKLNFLEWQAVDTKFVSPSITGSPIFDSTDISYTKKLQINGAMPEVLLLAIQYPGWNVRGDSICQPEYYEYNTGGGVVSEYLYWSAPPNSRFSVLSNWFWQIDILTIKWGETEVVNYAYNRQNQQFEDYLVEKNLRPLFTIYERDEMLKKTDWPFIQMPWLIDMTQLKKSVSNLTQGITNSQTQLDIQIKFRINTNVDRIRFSQPTPPTFNLIIAQSFRKRIEYNPKTRTIRHNTGINF